MGVLCISPLIPILKLKHFSPLLASSFSQSKASMEEIAFCGYDNSSPTVPSLEWFSIKLDPYPVYSSHENKRVKLNHNQLKPFSVSDFDKHRQHEAIGSNLCYINGLNVMTLDVNSPSDGWKLSPPMTLSRHYPKTTVLDGNLYVLGGFASNSPPNLIGWMEVFDPISQTWNSLPNPPSPICPYNFTCSALESKKQILVIEDSADMCRTKFHTYDVNTTCWTTCEIQSHDLFVHRSSKTPVAVGTTLYWVDMDDCNKADYCLIQAYDLDKDVWLHGGFNTGQIFRSPEIDFTGYLPRLVHLGGLKFGFLLQSSIFKRCVAVISYVSCFIFEVSPIFEDDGKGKHNHDEDDDDDASFPKLRISLVSIHRYPLPHALCILDTLLL
jgi:hypothetical protein